MPSLLNSPEHGKETIDRGTPLIVGAIGRDAARTFRHEDVREVAWEIFKAADSDGEEEVTVQELRNALRKFKVVNCMPDIPMLCMSCNRWAWHSADVICHRRTSLGCLTTRQLSCSTRSTSRDTATLWESRGKSSAMVSAHTLQRREGDRHRAFRNPSQLAWPCLLGSRLETRAARQIGLCMVVLLG